MREPAMVACLLAAVAVAGCVGGDAPRHFVAPPSTEVVEAREETLPIAGTLHWSQDYGAYACPYKAGNGDTTGPLVETYDAVRIDVTFEWNATDARLATMEFRLMGQPVRSGAYTDTITSTTGPSPLHWVLGRQDIRPHKFNGALMLWGPACGNSDGLPTVGTGLAQDATYSGTVTYVYGTGTNETQPS